MADSDIPSFGDDDDDEATMMWNREEFDPEGDLSAAELEAAVKSPRPQAKTPSQLNTGLDEAALFSDVLDSQEISEPSIPVAPLVDKAGTSSIGRAPSPPPAVEVQAEPEEVAAPSVPSLVAPAPEVESRLGLWVGVGVVALLGLSVGAYVLRDHLGPLGPWLDSLGLPF